MPMYIRQATSLNPTLQNAINWKDIPDRDKSISVSNMHHEFISLYPGIIYINMSALLRRKIQNL